VRAATHEAACSTNWAQFVFGVLSGATFVAVALFVRRTVFRELSSGRWLVIVIVIVFLHCIRWEARNLGLCAPVWRFLGRAGRRKPRLAPSGVLGARESPQAHKAGTARTRPFRGVPARDRDAGAKRGFQRR